MPQTTGPDGLDDEDLDASLDIDAREAARARRRDHDAEAARRDLMRPGMGKVFKQITDSWGEKADPEQKRAQKSGRGSRRPR
jgi:hypothetical protein